MAYSEDEEYTERWLDLAQTPDNLSKLLLLEAQPGQFLHGDELEMRLNSGDLSEYAVSQIARRVEHDLLRITKYVRAAREPAYVISRSAGKEVVMLVGEFERKIKQTIARASTTHTPPLIRLMFCAVEYGFCVACCTRFSGTPLDPFQPSIPPMQPYAMTDALRIWLDDQELSQRLSHIAGCCGGCMRELVCGTCLTRPLAVFDNDDLGEHLSNRTCMRCAKFSLLAVKRPVLRGLGRKLAKHGAIADIVV